MATVAAPPPLQNIITTNTTNTTTAATDAVAYRSASTEHLQLVQPTPDCYSPRTSSVGRRSISRNVERLEQSADELSQGGFDIGEEIRKLKEEQRRRDDSRRSSVASAYKGQTSTRSRGTSFANSIVSVNREARWGGYSPAAFVGSPTQSFHSENWSRLASMDEAGLMATARPEPVQEGRPLDSPLASPGSFVKISHAANISRRTSLNQAVDNSRKVSVSSKLSLSADVHDTVEDPEPTMETVDLGHEEPEHIQDTVIDSIDVTSEEAPLQAVQSVPSTSSQQLALVTERPGSSDTYRQAATLFQDFDGVHFSPSQEEFIEYDDEGNEIRRIGLDEATSALYQQQQQLRQRQSTLMSRPVSTAFAYPAPAENMVFYPAPVPRMLNLPKKLSSRPASGIQAQQRRSMMALQATRSPSRATLQLSASHVQLPPQDQDELEDHHDEGLDQATPLPISPTRSASPERRPIAQQRSSMASLNRLSGLPPQLRASAFFDQPAVQQSFDIQSDSAVATLDSILKASATAPVGVFTDHPFAGAAGAAIYAKEKPVKRNTLSTPLVVDAKNKEASRPETTRRRSIGSMLTGKLERRASGLSTLTDLGNAEGNKLRKRSSRLSLGSQDMLQEGQTERAASPTPSRALDEVEQHDDYEQAAQDEAEAEAEEDLDDYAHGDMGPVYAAPTTLLAELQMRKAQQKSRTRTAANAFPNGMHATLLELDAVAQIESRKRKTHKVALAWEDPATHEAQGDDENEDVPLGMLYPSKNGMTHQSRRGNADWDRPLGLVERRQLEDSEPLSSRRNRILGIKPIPASGSASLGGSDPSTHPEPEDPDEDLPLAERRRRIKQKAVLDSALGGVADDRPASFAADVFSEIGIPSTDTTKSGQDTTAPEEGETLGQRRARLQREKSGLSMPVATNKPGRPPLRGSTSLANILASAPLDANSSTPATKRAVSGPGAGTLLDNATRTAQENSARLREGNSRQTSYVQHRREAQMAELNRRNSLGNLLDAGVVPSGMSISPSVPTLLGGLAMQQNQAQAARAGVGGAYLPASTPLGQQGYANAQVMGMGQGQGLAAAQANIHAMQAKMLAASGQMLNPLAFSNFVPPVQPTGMGFGGGMAAAPGGYFPQAMGMGMGQMGMGMGMGMGQNGMGMGMGQMGMGMVQYSAPQPLGAYGIPTPEAPGRDSINRWRSSVAQ